MDRPNLLHLILAPRADFTPSDKQLLEFIDTLHGRWIDQDCWKVRLPGADGLTAYAGAYDIEREYLAEELETLGADVALIAEPPDDGPLRSLMPSDLGDRQEAGLALIRATDFLIPPHSEQMRYPFPRCTACGRPLKRTQVSIASECGHCGTASDLTDDIWNLYDYWDGSLRQTDRSLATRFAIVFDCSTDWPPQDIPYPDLIRDRDFLAAAETLCGGQVMQFPVSQEGGESPPG